MALTFSRQVFYSLKCGLLLRSCASEGDTTKNKNASNHGPKHLIYDSYRKKMSQSLNVRLDSSVAFHY